MKRSILHSPRIEELKRRKCRILKIKIILFFFCFLIILTGLVFLSRWKKLNIENIQISGNKIIESQIIETIAKENLTGYYFWLFPKTNFIIYPQNKIERELKDKFKRIKDVFINDKNIKTLEIIISEREGGYLWCGEVLPSLTSDAHVNEKCYFLDPDGYIFDEAPYFSSNIYFKFYGPNINTDNPFGSYFLQKDFAKIISFKDTIEKMNLKPSAFELGNDGDANIYLSSGIMPSMGPKIIFKLDSDFNKLAENLQAAISTEPLQTKLKKEFNSLLYIDLRFGNKVYYKFSAEGAPSGGN